MDLTGASPLVFLGIPGLAALAAVLLVGGAAAAAPPAFRLRSALAAFAFVSVIAAGSGALAASGLLADAARRPPPFMPMMAAILVATVAFARSPLGARISGLPLWMLVGFQGFRLPLELVMRQAAREGVMPVQMSFEGWNFDVVTGATALLLGAALAFSKVPRGLVLAWNVLGSALLFTIVSIAVASAPWFAAFGPDRVNEFVLHVPYVWLATVLVPSALLGHALVYRRLVRDFREARARRGASAPISPRRTPGSRAPA